MDHLGAGVGLLAIVGDGDRIKLTDAALTAQHAARIFPGDRAAGFHLRPAHLAVLAEAVGALGDKIIDAALAVGIAGIPVLHGGIFDLGIVQGHQLNDRGVQLVFIAHRRRAAFEIGDIAALVGDDQRAFELAGVGSVDAEIGGKLHRAAHAGRDVDKGAIGKHRAVQAGKIIVLHGHDTAQPFLDQVGIFLHRFGNRQEDHAGLEQFGAEGGGHRHAVKHRIHGHAARAFNTGQHLLLFDRDAQLFIGAADFGIELVQRCQGRLGLGRGVIIGILIIDRRDVQLGPIRAHHRLPARKRLQPPCQQPFRLALLGRNVTNRVLVQALGRHFGFDIRRKAPFVGGHILHSRPRGCILDRGILNGSIRRGIGQGAAGQDQGGGGIKHGHHSSNIRWPARRWTRARSPWVQPLPPAAPDRPMSQRQARRALRG